MKDNYGDKVATAAGADEVYLYIAAGVDYADAVLTPKKARKLARKLNRAADRVEAPRGLATNAPVKLTLNQRQAETLMVILGRIGGTTGALGTRTTARKYADEVHALLAHQGLTDDLAELPEYQIDDADRAIYFIGVAE